MVTLLDKIIFGENGRSIATFYSSKLEEIKEYIDNGWSHELDYLGEGMWLRSPDEWLVDITDPFKVIYYGNERVNLAYYLYLKDLNNKKRLEQYINLVISKRNLYYKNFEFAISKGMVLETEIRILGNDNRLKTLKMDIFKEFYYSENFNIYYNKVAKEMAGCRNLLISRKDRNTWDANMKQYYKELEKYNSVIKKKIKYENYQISKIEEQLPQYDVIVFIPNGGYKYLPSFLTLENAHKIMFWEKHANNHLKMNLTLYKRDVKNKKVLIVDNVYSGKTLYKLKKEIETLGANVSILGLFPQNKKCIEYLDYVMILDRIYDIKTLPEEFEFDILYKKICCENYGEVVNE